MATYQELFELSLDPTLVRRLTIAIAIECEAIRVADPQDPVRVVWAKRALQNPDGMARQLLLCALAQNAAATVAEIQSVDDATLQSAVSAAVALLL